MWGDGKPCPGVCSVCAVAQVDTSTQHQPLDELCITKLFLASFFSIFTGIGFDLTALPLGSNYAEDFWPCQCQSPTIANALADPTQGSCVASQSLTHNPSAHNFNNTNNSNRSSNFAADSIIGFLLTLASCWCLSAIFPQRCHRTSLFTKRKPGPKSGHSRLISCAVAILSALCIFIMSHHATWNGGEGYFSTSWTEVGANFNAEDLHCLLAAKSHDNALPRGYGPVDCNTPLRKLTGVQKRSLQRAYARAQIHGSAWYRGRCLTINQFPKGFHARSPNTKPKLVFSTPSKTHTPRYRMQIGHVNVGGIAQPRLQEVKQWALHQAIDILLLSETRWSFEAEWCDPHWYHIHTGTSSDKADGLLFLIRRTVCQPDQIGFASVFPGRIGHLRIHFHKRAFDLIGCYQYPAARSAAQQDLRHKFWDCLTSHAAQIPNRNAALFIGDFNCSIAQHGPHVGTAHYTWQSLKRLGPVHSDSTRLHDFMQQHQLTALNCWRASDPPTFINEPATSRIDHILMRLSEVDGAAKSVTFFPDAPFLPLSGARHIPMVCTIRKIPIAFTKHTQTYRCTLPQRIASRHAWTTNSQTWQQFQHDFHQQFTQFTHQPHDDLQLIDGLHSTMMPTFQKIFPTTRNSTATADEDSLQERTVRSKWYHREQFLIHQPATIKTVLHAWFHWARFAALKRQQYKFCRLLKKQKFADLLHEVTTAAHQT